jgi:Flp pilus assembly pilin Flp
VEYALIAALIAVVILGAVQGASESLRGTMTYIADALEQAAGA